MYKRYNLNELAQSVQALKEKNTLEGLGEEIELFTLMGEIGFDFEDVKDFARYCNLRLYDSKKYNEDFEYKSQIEKTNFKKYLQKEREKISGILERLDKREPWGKWKGERKETPKNIKPKAVDIIPSRSNERFSIALGKIINHSSIDVEMLSHLIECEVFEIQSYLTGKYRDPPRKFIEEISSFFGVDPRHFQEYREYLGKDYKEDDDRPITLVNYRITKKIKEIYKLPEQSNEEFRESFRKLMGASGIGEKELANILHCATNSFYPIGRDKKFEKVLMERIAHFFNISPSYFKEYRENEIKEKLSADTIKYKKETHAKHKEDKATELKRRYREYQREYQREYRKKNSAKAREVNKQYRENNRERERERAKIWYKENRAVVIEKAKEYCRANKTIT